MLTACLVVAACGSESSVPAIKEDTKPSTKSPAESHSDIDRTVEQSAGQEVDPSSGLIIDEGWELVRGHCAACHSARLVTQNRGNRQTWEDMIRWMQETQGLWPLDAVTENAILDYLARNYAPRAGARRAPLPAELMPLNPYEPKASQLDASVL